MPNQMMGNPMTGLTSGMPNQVMGNPMTGLTTGMPNQVMGAAMLGSTSGNRYVSYLPFTKIHLQSACVCV